jgi:hypothetical protein
MRELQQDCVQAQPQAVLEDQITFQVAHTRSMEHIFKEWILQADQVEMQEQVGVLELAAAQVLHR